MPKRVKNSRPSKAEPKILIWDIETSHNLAAIFRLFEDYTSHENITQERYVICAAWKYLGEKKIHTVSVLDDPKRYAKNPHDDYHVVSVLHRALSEADVIVAHNGDSYDIKFAEGRMLFHSMAPLPPIPSIDTLKVAKSRLLLNSNKLDYLGKYLGFGTKIKTHNSWWLQVLQGDKSAIKKMIPYNRRDVELLEKVFLKLRPYAANHFNRHLLGLGSEGCPRCGSHNVQSRGTHRAISNVYNRFQCQDCGGWYREKAAIKSVKVATRVL